MLEQFVESEKNQKKGNRRGKFLVTTTMLVCTIFLNGILWSLFAADLGIGTGDFELSSVVAPVVSADPFTPEPIKKTDKPEQNQKSELPTRQDNIARIDEVQQIPDKIATESNGLKARPKGKFIISSQPESDGSSPNGITRGNTTGGGVIANNSNKFEDEASKADEPPTRKKIEPEVVAQKPRQQSIISKGVITGNATSLPKPTYPAAARALHAGGDVNVQVTIDESGNVISANAISGHPLLKQVSEAAARGAKFNPTLLSNQPVKVTGIIVYRFVAQ